MFSGETKSAATFVHDWKDEKSWLLDELDHLDFHGKYKYDSLPWDYALGEGILLEWKLPLQVFAQTSKVQPLLNIHILNLISKMFFSGSKGKIENKVNY